MTAAAAPRERRVLRALLLLVYRLLKPAGRTLHALVRRIAPGFAAEFFGSDIFERYTATYAWAANQVGHVAIGALLVIAPAALAAWTGAVRPAAWGAGVGALFWALCYVVKEIADAALAEESASRLFPLDALELGLDSLDDTAFVLTGVVLAALACAELTDKPLPAWLGGTAEGPPWAALAAAGVLAIYAVRRIRVVRPVKRRFDRSCLPYFVRLARFNGELVGTWTGTRRNTDPAAAILAFARNDPAAPDLVTLAAAHGQSGRTWLACAIGCEATARNLAVRYTTWAALRTGQAAPIADAEPVDHAAIVIIDDCDADPATVRRALPAGTRRLMVVMAGGSRPDADPCPRLDVTLAKGVTVSPPARR